MAGPRSRKLFIAHKADLFSSSQRGLFALPEKRTEAARNGTQPACQAGNKSHQLKAVVNCFGGPKNFSYLDGLRKFYSQKCSIGEMS